MNEAEDQVHMSPFPDGLFTFEEYVRALQLVAPEAEAAELARGLAEPLEDFPAPTPVPEATQTGERRWGARPVRGLMISEDTLILLSLVSQDLESRVDRFRAYIRGQNQRFASDPGDEAEEEARWHSRRTQIREALVQAGRLRLPGSET